MGKLSFICILIRVHLLLNGTLKINLEVKMTITISPEHGYVILAASGAFLLNLWQMMKIGGKRKELGIMYPQMYSDKHPVFNCYQRAHQNTLEFTPFYLALVILGGLRHPTFAAGAGGIYLVARIIYSLGYYTGNPKSRIPGFILNLLALTALLGCSVSTAAGLLVWW